MKLTTASAIKAISLLDIDSKKELFKELLKKETFCLLKHIKDGPFGSILEFNKLFLSFEDLVEYCSEYVKNKGKEKYNTEGKLYEYFKDGNEIREMSEDDFVFQLKNWCWLGKNESFTVSEIIIN